MTDSELNNQLKLLQLLQIQYIDFIFSAHKILKHWIPAKKKFMKALLSLNIHCVSPKHLAQESVVSSFKFSISKNALVMEMQGIHA